jgi:hypothetical protein
MSCLYSPTRIKIEETRKLFVTFRHVPSGCRQGADQVGPDARSSAHTCSAGHGGREVVQDGERALRPVR